MSFYARADGYGHWAAIEKATGEFIGRFSLCPDEGDLEKVELGYRLRRSAWGKGYATEGSQALVDKGFSEPFHEPRPETIEGTDEGDVEYALTRSEWEQRSSS